MSKRDFEQQKQFMELRTGEESQQILQSRLSKSGEDQAQSIQTNRNCENTIWGIAAFIFIALLSFFFYSNLPKSHSSPTLNTLNSEQPRTIPSLSFKKIFWVYTESQFDGESMYEIIYLHHQNHTFHQQGYEVRFVNSWDAYDYISDNGTVSRIGKTMQNSQIDEGVHNLLKLALLYQHGGVIINLKDTIIVNDDLTWIEDIFRTVQQNKTQTQKVFLYDLNSSTPSNLSDVLIAAQPKSALIKHAFDALETLIRTGTHPYANQTQILMKNEDRGIDYLPGGLSSIFNLVAFAKKQQLNASHFDPKAWYNIQSVNERNFIFINQISGRSHFPLFLGPNYKQKLRHFNNYREVKLIFNANQSLVANVLSQKAMYLGELNPQPLPQGSLIKKILQAPHNKDIFIDPLPQRQVSLCLIMMDNLNKTQIETTKTAFLNQTYNNWKLVIPSLDPVAQQEGLQKVNGTLQKVKIVNGKSNKVHNIEKACTRHCDPRGYAVLLNFGQYFNSVEALQEIAKTVSPRDTAGAFISLQFNGSKRVTNSFPPFNRSKYAMANVQVQKLETIINQLRIISIQTFRYIPQMDLRDIFGKYHNDRLVFLMTILGIVRDKKVFPFHYYLAKKYIHTMNLPTNVYFVSQSVTLKVHALESVDTQQLKLLRPRLQCQQIRLSMIQTRRYSLPFSKMFAFNPGDDFVSVDNRRGPDLIPKIIHQVWLGSQITPARQYFYRKTQKMYPDYEVKFWREENITQQKFPLTYDVLQTLLKFNKRSPYNKLASVTDILRHQILYHQGGFWKDSGMNFLRPIFDKVLKYKLFLPVDKTFRYRWLQGMCIFGNMPQYQNLWRITNFRNINRMRIYDNYALNVAGPIDFNQLLVGQQEYDPDIILMPYQTFYPGQLIQHPDGDLCTKQSSELNGAAYQVEQNGWYLLSNCSQIYPLAYGIEHNHFGGTWNKRENIPK